MKIIITEEDAEKEYCGEFELTDWLDGGREGYGDQFNAQAVVILSKAVELLIRKCSKTASYVNIDFNLYPDGKLLTNKNNKL